MPTAPTVHHYVPRFLLRRFADPKTGQVWVYEKGAGRSWRCNPENVAAERRYYAFTGESGQPDNTVEAAFSELEGRVAGIIERCEREKTLTTTDERGILAEFIACSLLRVPSFRKPVERFVGLIAKKLSLLMAHHPDAFERSVRKMEQETGQTFNAPVEEVRKPVTRNHFIPYGWQHTRLEIDFPVVSRLT